MILKRIFIGLLLGSFLACVPAKQYDELRQKHKALEDRAHNLENDLKKMESRRLEDDRANSRYGKEIEELKYDIGRLTQERDALQMNYDRLKESFDALERSSSSALQENAQKNRELLAAIEEKQDQLNAELAELDRLQRELEIARQDVDKRGKRIDELEEVIRSKEKQMTELKNKISAALTNFEGKGLEVYQKDGKVYVSMENKLLFRSGSWEVNAQGQEAVGKLASVLAENPTIRVLIEGHTDNVPFSGSGVLQNNWDLSTKRATAVVEILLRQAAIQPQNITAAGRSKYAPVADNTTAEGKAKNRRIEVILTPELDELSQLLQTDE